MAYAVHEINQMADKQKAFADEVVYAAGNFAEIAGLLEKYGQADAAAEVQKAYRDEMLQKSRLMSSTTALKSVIEKMVSGRIGAATAENVAQMYLDSLDEIHAGALRTVDNSDEMQEFKKTVWEIGHPGEPFIVGGDDELAMISTGTGAEDNLICPITRMELVDPVRSTCGHVFSKDAILGYLRTHARARLVDCPVAGCPHAISKDTLKVDAKTQQKLANLKKRKRPEEEANVEDL
jgi:hypothetical protein